MSGEEGYGKVRPARRVSARAPLTPRPQVLALYDYQQAYDDELSFTKGDIIIVTCVSRGLCRAGAGAGAGWDVPHRWGWG